MTTRPGPGLTALTVGDPTVAWKRLGFRIVEDRVRVGDVRIGLGGPAGISAWGLDRVGSADALRHIPVPGTVSLPIGPAPKHRNHVTHIDHLVLRVGNLDDAAADLATLGIDIRRTRDAVLGGVAMVQLFAWVGATILEVVGPPVPTTDRARLWGLTFVSTDLAATAVQLGDLAGPIRDAVQPGREICSLDTRGLGGTVPLAVMSPHR